MPLPKKGSICLLLYETTLELNFFIGKLKHTVKRKRRDNGPDIVEEPEVIYGKGDEDKLFGEGGRYNGDDDDLD